MPLEIVHVYTYVPTTDAVAVVVPEALSLKMVVPGPEVCVHSPVPDVGVLPPKEPVDNVPHSFSVALVTVAVVGVVKKLIVSYAELGAHVPLEIVHLYIYVPSMDTLAEDVAEVALPKMVVPGPDIIVH